MPEGVVAPDPTKDLISISGTNANILSIWSNILNRVSAYTDGKKLLEVGVGSGELLAVALELGYLPEAVEIVPEVAHKIANIVGVSIRSLPWEM